MVKVLISGKTQEPGVYKQNLNDFIEKYPESSLVPYARNLQSKLDSHSSNRKEMKETGGVYKPAPDNKVHYFLIVYGYANEIDTILLNEVKRYNVQNFADKKLSSDLMKQDVANKIVIVKQFPDKYNALEYYARFKDESSPLNKYKGLNLNVFIISDENFQTFYQNKDLSGYLAFFEKTY